VASFQTVPTLRGQVLPIGNGASALGVTFLTALETLRYVWDLKLNIDSLSLGHLYQQLDVHNVRSEHLKLTIEVIVVPS
jgi:hypothetical protein